MDFKEPLISNVFLNADIAEAIFLLLDTTSLCASEFVCKQWRDTIIDNRIWKRLVKRYCARELLWRRRCEEKDWFRYLGATENDEQPNCHALYNKIDADLKLLKRNWKEHRLAYQIPYTCNTDMSKVYCFQYNSEIITSGHQDHTLKTWHRKHPHSTPLSSAVHSRSVLSLQFNEKMMVTCSSDGSIKIFNVKEETEPNCIHYGNNESPLSIKFHNGILVAGFTKGTVVVWMIMKPSEVHMKGELKEHAACVNAVDVDDKYIVSGSGDRVIKVWDREKLFLISSLTGHKRGVTCVHLREDQVASGSTDKSVRLWHVRTGKCLRIFEFHTDIVRSVQMNHQYIVSGSYDKTVVVWDLAKAFLTEDPPCSAIFRILRDSPDPILHVKFDEFKIVASNNNNKIFIWDFLDWIP